MPPITPDHQGYKIFVAYNDHPPPHFHIKGNGSHCRISIASGEAMDGS